MNLNTLTIVVIVFVATAAIGYGALVLTNWNIERNIEKQKRKYLNKHGCDSCCPRCRKWESDGNTILSEDQPDGTIQRQCAKCGHSWIAIFTPAGFIPIEDTIFTKVDQDV